MLPKKSAAPLMPAATGKGAERHITKYTISIAQASEKFNRKNSKSCPPGQNNGRG